MILTLSLNLVNGYMGEFSVGHAGFMGIGAYVASVLTVAVLPPAWAALAFPAVLIAGGAAAAAGRADRGLPLLPHPGRLPGHRDARLQHDRQERPGKYLLAGGPPGLSGHAPPHHAVLGGRLGDPDPVGLAQPGLFQLRAGDHGHPGRRSGRQPDLRGYPAPQALRLPHFRLLRRGGRGACTPTCSSSSTPGAFPS